MYKNVMICDDQQVFIDKFKEEHKDYYTVEEVNDVRVLTNRLHNMKRLPDVLLLDLYHPQVQGEDFDQKRDEAEKELVKLNEQVKVTKKAVEKVWEPLGLSILKDIRKDFKAEQLPVIIYSQRGLFLLDDEDARRVDECDAHWLLKQQFKPVTEKTRIDRIIRDEKIIAAFSKKSNDEKRMASLLKRYKLTLIIFCIIAAFTLVFFVLPINSVLCQILISIISSVTAGILIDIPYRRIKFQQK